MTAHTLSRRRLLQTTALTAAWAALAGCSTESQPAPTPTLSHSPGLLPSPSAPLRLPTASPLPTLPYSSGLLPSQSLLGEATPADTVLHLLRRTTFGPTAADVERVRAMGIEAYLDEQLNPEALDASEVESRLARLTTLSMTPGELFEKLGSEEIRRPQIVGELIAATLTRHVYSPRQLFEVMVDFWSDHFRLCRNITFPICSMLRPRGSG